MSQPVNHWKLGLFVVSGGALALVVFLFLAARSLKTETVSYKSYFDESVQGLDVGSPVKFRGVTIGAVSLIDVASDRRHVEVTCEVNAKAIADLGLGLRGGLRPKLVITPDLRVQLASSGLTGVKFILMDFFDPATNPPPILPFPTPDNYIPAAPSTMKNLEDSVVKAVSRFPELADEILRVLVRIGKLLDDVDGKRLSQTAVATLGHVDEVLGSIQRTLKEVNPAGLSQGAAETLEGLNVTITRMNGLLERVEADDGLVSSAQRASDAVGDLARNTNGLGRELEVTLREVQGAADAVQRLADGLSRDPDMLLKGHAARRKP